MIECGFFDSVNKDRLYRADEMTRPYELLVSNGVFATPEGTASTYLQVYAHDGMDIVVKPGRGIFKDKWLINNSDMLLTVDTSEVTLTRIDSVIVKINTAESVRRGTIEIKKGTPASSPVAPAMERSLDVHEYRLADITVGPKVTGILQKNITDMRGSADCPWVTSLVKQVDTSTLLAQWQDAYERYYEQVEADNQAYYNSNKSRFDSYYSQVQKSFDDFYSSNSARFDTFYNTNNARFDKYYTDNDKRFDDYEAEVSARFDNYYTTNSNKFDTYYSTVTGKFDTFYNTNSKRFDDYYTTNKSTFDTYYSTINSKFDTFYNSNSKRFDDYYYENDARFDEYYELNAETFNTWFQEMKDTAGNLTLIRMYSSNYVTTSAGQTVIPINIDQFNNPLDILQVYINGLLAIEGVDYTIANIPDENVTLKKAVAQGTNVSFSVIKSSDAVITNSVIQQVAALETKVADLEARIRALES